MGLFSNPDRDLGAYNDGALASPEATAELKKLGREVHNALDALRSSIEAKDIAKTRRVEEFFSKYEDENHKLVVEHLIFKKRLEAIEEAEGAVYAKGGILTPAGRDTKEYSNFHTYLTKGTRAEGIDFKTLRTDSESAGGYLIPQVMDNRIRKNIIEISPIRAHARTRVATGKVMDVPRRLSIPIAQFEGEAETGPTDQAIYGSEQVTLYRQTCSVPATMDMLVSSAFDLEVEIAEDVGVSFAQGEGVNFVSGSGRKSPQGILSDTPPRAQSPGRISRPWLASSSAA
jgi:HK97 family phage major capsid protein